MNKNKFDWFTFFSVSWSCCWCCERQHREGSQWGGSSPGQVGIFSAWKLAMGILTNHLVTWSLVTASFVSHLNDPRSKEIVMMRTMAPINCCHILVKLQGAGEAGGGGHKMKRVERTQEQRVTELRRRRRLRESSGIAYLLCSTQSPYQRLTDEILNLFSWQQ